MDAMTGRMFVTAAKGNQHYDLRIESGGDNPIERVLRVYRNEQTRALRYAETQQAILLVPDSVSEADMLAIAMDMVKQLQPHKPVRQLE